VWEFYTDGVNAVAPDIGRRESVRQFAQALLVSVVVVCVFAGISMALHHSWEQRLAEEGRQAGSAELMTIRQNLFLLMSGQRMFTALLGQRIEESIEGTHGPSLSDLSSYLAYEAETSPSFLYATIARDGKVIDQYPLFDGHSVGFDLSLLPQWKEHILALTSNDTVSLDGPIYDEGGGCYLVSRYLLTWGGEIWGLLTLHYDFRLFLSQIGIDELPSEYRYSFNFTHPGGEETYHWGEDIDEERAVMMEASYSFLSWQMRLVPKGEWAGHGMARTLFAVMGLFISLLMGLFAFLWMRHYQRIERHSVTDSLTGLLNRRQFSRELERECNKKRAFAISLMDIDDFKEINDTWGHLDGDEVLLQLVGRMKESVRMSDTIARFGGDEFIILLRDCYSASFVERLHQALSPFEVTIKGETVRLELSMGVAFYPLDATDADMLVKIADHRMYHAKMEGKGRVCVYSELGS